MKLSDLLILKSIIDKIPHAAVSWLLTITTIISMVAIYIGIRQIAGEYKQDKAADRAVMTRLAHNDSIQNLALRDILLGQSITDLKIKTIGDHVNNIERGNGLLLKEIRQIDEMRNIFAPLQMYMKQDTFEKKNSLTQQVTR